MTAMSTPAMGQAANDPDTLETREWIDALHSVIAQEGPQRALFLLDQLIDEARQSGVDMPFSATTAYVNTIDTDDEQEVRALRAFLRNHRVQRVDPLARLQCVGVVRSLAHGGRRHRGHGCLLKKLNSSLARVWHRFEVVPNCALAFRIVI